MVVSAFFTSKVEKEPKMYLKKNLTRFSSKDEKLDNDVVSSAFFKPNMDTFGMKKKRSLQMFIASRKKSKICPEHSDTADKQNVDDENAGLKQRGIERIG